MKCSRSRSWSSFKTSLAGAGPPPASSLRGPAADTSFGESCGIDAVTSAEAILLAPVKTLRRVAPIRPLDHSSEQSASHTGVHSSTIEGSIIADRAQFENGFLLGGVPYGLAVLEMVLDLVLASIAVTGFTGLLRGDE